MLPASYVIDRKLLRRILGDPTGTHAGAEIQDGVCVGHLDCVRSTLHSNDASPMEEFWCGDRSVALHCVLYHLGGGAAAGLRPPPPTGAERDERMCCTPEYSRAEWQIETLTKERENKRKAISKGSATRKEGDALLADPYPLDMMRDPLASPAGPVPRGKACKSTAAAPPPPPATPRPREVELARRLSCRLALAMGTHGRLGMCSPVYMIGGKPEILSLIAEFAGFGGGLWLAQRGRELHPLQGESGGIRTPQPSSPQSGHCRLELQPKGWALESLLRQEVHVLREMLAERDATIASLEQSERKAWRHAEDTQRRLEAGSSQTEQRLALEREYVDEICRAAAEYVNQSNP